MLHFSLCRGPGQPIQNLVGDLQAARKQFPQLLLFLLEAAPDPFFLIETADVVLDVVDEFSPFTPLQARARAECLW